jgi:broad specificity phosphatase PhoE
MTIYLVRHAMPLVDPDTDPARWRLGSDGLAAARQLSGRLPTAALLIASTEPKAWQTLDPDGNGVVRRDSRLGEVKRPREYRADFRCLRRRYVRGAFVPGWEPQADVAARFAAAVSEAMERAAARDLVLASHGMAMTVWLTRAVALTDPQGFWDGLLFPDLLAVDLAAGTVARIP